MKRQWMAVQLVVWALVACAEDPGIIATKTDITSAQVEQMINLKEAALENKLTTKEDDLEKKMTAKLDEIAELIKKGDKEMAAMRRDMIPQQNQYVQRANVEAQEQLPADTDVIPQDIVANNRKVFEVPKVKILDEVKKQVPIMRTTLEERHGKDTQIFKEKYAEAKSKANKLAEGAISSWKKYEKVSNSNDPKDLKGMKKLADKITKNADTIAKAANDIAAAVGKVKIIIDPDKSWQERASAGLELASTIAGYIPPPYGVIASSMFGIAAACFGAAAPTTNEYTKLRNQIFDGVRDMFDEAQKAEALGCIYKLEFLMSILNNNKVNKKLFKGGNTDPKRMAKKRADAAGTGEIDDTLLAPPSNDWINPIFFQEIAVQDVIPSEDDVNPDEFADLTDVEFQMIIQVGALDAGVATLGAMKWKMEEYRDKNTIKSGRRSVDMAHYYILLAEQRDILYAALEQFVTIGGSTEKAGLTKDFFTKTRRIAQADFKHLFWLDDSCCIKNHKHFSALLAYNMPLGKHYGEGKAANVIKKFLGIWRTQDYYDNEEYGMYSKYYLGVDNVQESGRAEVGFWTREAATLPSTTEFHTFINGQYTVRNAVEGAFWWYLGLLDKTTVTQKKYWAGPPNPLHCPKQSRGYPNPHEESGEGYVMEMGVVEYMNKARMKLTYVPEDKGDRFAANVVIKNTMSKRGPSSYVLATRDVLKKNSGLFDYIVPEETSVRRLPTKEEKQANIKLDMEKARKKYDLFALCSKEVKDTTVDAALRKTPAIRFFPVVKKGEETRFLIGPGGSLVGDELVLFGFRQKIGPNKVRVPDLSTESTDNGEKEITEAVLKEDAWKEVFFNLSYSQQDPDGAQTKPDSYPFSWYNSTNQADSTGYNTDVTCQLEAGDGTGTNHQWVPWYLSKTPEDCIRYCMTYKKHYKGDIDGITMYKDEEEKGCYCERQMTGVNRSEKKKWQTCFFIAEGISHKTITSKTCESVRDPMCNRYARRKKNGRQIGVHYVSEINARRPKGCYVDVASNKVMWNFSEKTTTKCSAKHQCICDKNTATTSERRRRRSTE